MIKPFDFYFDFISPYSFLAHKEIRKIEHKASIKVKYKPILLGGLHNLHGIKAPAFIPAKAKHMIRDCKLIAERNNVRFKFNSYFPIRSLNLMRGVFVAEEDNFKSYYIDSIFDAIWQDGLNMNDDNIISKILKNLNINPKTFALRATSSAIKDTLKKRTSEAHTYRNTAIFDKSASRARSPPEVAGVLNKSYAKACTIFRMASCTNIVSWETFPTLSSTAIEVSAPTSADDTQCCKVTTKNVTKEFRALSSLHPIKYSLNQLFSASKTEATKSTAKRS